MLVSLRVACALLTTAYAAATLAAEISYKPAFAARDFAALDRTAVLGFGRYWLREAPARAAILLGAGAPIALPRIAAALEHNPHSADLLAMRMKYQLMAGDPAGATESFRRLYRLVPNAASVRAICGAGPRCDVRFIPQ